MNPQRGPLDKARGAYYTEKRVAAALCRWALRRSGERVLDPAFGGGVFLEACARRLADLGGGEIFGVEVDRTAHAGATGGHGETLCGRRLLLADFFSLDADSLPAMQAVVGNPPFIRFQRFTGETRARAARRSLEQGVPLEPLAGSWVAFVAHATSFLATGGRLAMVVPAELGHAPYARPLLSLLQHSFSRSTIVSFRRSLFPHLDQRTVLVLADGFEEGPAEFRSLDLAGAEALEKPLPCAGDRALDADKLVTGRSSLAHAQLDAATMALYRDLPERGAIHLGELARVESGYVTGANSHFHLSPGAALASGLPNEVLVPAVLRSRALAGLTLTERDWPAAVESGAAGYLVQASGHEEHPAVAAFLRRLERAGVQDRYKTRNRAVWHKVPRVFAAPMLLTAMGGRGLRLVVNDAGLASPNTFHLVTPHSPDPAVRPSLAAAWLTSLTELSLELEGHALGGGMLKCDPGEALQVLLPPPAPLPPACLERLDRLLRDGEREAARQEADRLLLSGALGLSSDEIDALANAAAELSTRRK
ncbi:MAG: N-6 DNA methylase [Trueperaceae bacterium]